MITENQSLRYHGNDVDYFVERKHPHRSKKDPKDQLEKVSDDSHSETEHDAAARKHRWKQPVNHGVNIPWFPREENGKEAAIWSVLEQKLACAGSVRK